MPLKRGTPPDLRTFPADLILQRRLAFSRLLAPHERSADVCLGPTIPCGASTRNRQTRRCNTRFRADTDTRYPTPDTLLLPSVAAARRQTPGSGPDRPSRARNAPRCDGCGPTG